MICNTAKFIISQLVAQIVLQNDIGLATELSNSGVNASILTLSEEKNPVILQNTQILSSLLQKYPELRIITADIMIQTAYFDLKTLFYTTPTAPHNMSFFDYIMHVPKISIRKELLQSLYDVNTMSFPLLDSTTKREVTSHEYFRSKIVEKSLYGIHILFDPKTHDEKLLHSFYVEAIKNAIETRYYWSIFEEALINNTIARVEEMISVRIKGKMSLLQQNMIDLNDLYQILLNMNINNAFIQLDPATAESILQTNNDINAIFREDLTFSKALFREDLTFCKAIQQFIREYECFDPYLKSPKEFDWILFSNFTDLELNKIVQGMNTDILHLQEFGKNLDVTSIREETDDDRKALLVRAILENKLLDTEYQLSSVFSPYCHSSAEAILRIQSIFENRSKFSRIVRVKQKTQLK